MLSARSSAYGCFNPRARTGRDALVRQMAEAGIEVSIHAPRAGRDFARNRGIVRADDCFNPRAPRGARLAHAVHRSTHGSLFQSTRPGGARRGIAEQCLSGCRCFNPRAPRGARRQRSHDPNRLQSWFQSTRPGGARHLARSQCRRQRDMFQSTRPVRGATARSLIPSYSVTVSIHAPRTGRDTEPLCVTAARHDEFQSTRPARGATAST